MTEPQHHLDPASAEVTAQHNVAPVDLQSDPTSWWSGRTLLIVLGVSVLILIVTVIICLAVWLTPPMDPLQIPTEERI
jgi:hypothetical protein